MQRSTIKEHFGGEVPFTKFLSQDKITQERLLEVVDLTMSDDLTVTPEDKTIDSKRVDVTITDSDGVTMAVIESQDATGWLDSIHASKITYYMYEKNCFTGILLTEDADEHIKGFIRYINENTPFNIWLIDTLVYVLEDKPYVDFVPIMRPFSIIEKKIQRKNNNGQGVTEFNGFLEQKMLDYPGLWTNQTGSYLSKNRLGKYAMQAVIMPRKNGFRVQACHRGSHDTDKFRETFTNFCQQHNYDPLFNKQRGYFAVDTWDQAFDAFNVLYKDLESNNIFA